MPDARPHRARFRSAARLKRPKYPLSSPSHPGQGLRAGGSTRRTFHEDARQLVGVRVPTDTLVLAGGDYRPAHPDAVAALGVQRDPGRGPDEQRRRPSAQRG